MITHDTIYGKNPPIAFLQFVKCLQYILNDFKSWILFDSAVDARSGRQVREHSEIPETMTKQLLKGEEYK